MTTGIYIMLLYNFNAMCSASIQGALSGELFPYSVTERRPTEQHYKKEFKKFCLHLPYAAL